MRLVTGSFSLLMTTGDSPHPIHRVHVAVTHTYALHSQLPRGFHGSVLAFPSPQKETVIVAKTIIVVSKPLSWLS